MTGCKQDTRFLSHGEEAFQKENYALAVKFFKLAVLDLENKDGQETQLAEALNNLAAAYRCLGEHTEAEPILLRGAALAEEVLGSAHPDLGIVLNNVASFYLDQRQFTLAEPLYQRAWGLYKTIKQLDHPCVAAITKGLMVIYQETGREDEVNTLLKLF